jgi:hypothetical protein
VDRFRIVACTNAPRLAALASVQPDASGDWPSGPVSCHGVLSPRAVSGLAGTMMSQFMLAAGGGAVTLALGEGDGQGVGGAVADADGDADGLGPGEAAGDALRLAPGEAAGDALGLGPGEAAGDAPGFGPEGAVAGAVGTEVGSVIGEGGTWSLPAAAGTPPPAAEADAVAAGPVVADAVAVGPTQ